MIFTKREAWDCALELAKIALANPSNKSVFMGSNNADDVFDFIQTLATRLENETQN